VAVCDEILTFITSALKQITSDEQVLSEVREITTSCLLRHKMAAEEELRRIFDDEKQHPQTYNHYYTDNIQKDRLQSTRTMIEKLMKEVSKQEWGGRLHISNNSVDADRLLSALQSRINVDMTAQGCEEALTDLKAYYKV
jgi:hypothetical protein